MTNEVELILKQLRDVDNCNMLDYIDDAVDLIEELSEELEHAQQEKAELEIMLTAAQSAAETWKRKLDAAIWDLKTKSYYCESCAHYKPGHFCLGCRNKSNYEWHGV